uniref:Taste receptor type 2 n=1 Tax=Anolis carolinensis TaxID=28377 RepID=A0A803T2I8_ANOCA
MSSPQLISFILALVDLALGGFISNGFILTVILRVWNKSRSLDSSEQLLLSLVLTNLWATVLVILTCINDYIIPMFPKSLMYSLNDFIIICRHWFTACLCVFYYIKIVNSTHSLFLWCKLRISWLVPRLIAGSLVVSLFLVLFMSFFTLINIQRNTTLIGTQMNEEISQHHNTGIHEILFLIVGSGSPLLVILVCCILVVASLCKKEDTFRYRSIDVPQILFLIVGSGPPLLMISGCSILVVVSLCRHMYRMKCKEHFSKNLQIKAHIKAAGIILSILFLYLIFYVVQTFSLLLTMKKMEGIFVTVLIIVYPCAQAYILLLGNPKLNQAAAQVFPRRET